MTPAYGGMCMGVVLAMLRPKQDTPPTGWLVHSVDAPTSDDGLFMPYLQYAYVYLKARAKTNARGCKHHQPQTPAESAR